MGEGPQDGPFPHVPATPASGPDWMLLSGGGAARPEPAAHGPHLTQPGPHETRVPGHRGCGPHLSSRAPTLVPVITALLDEPHRWRAEH